MKAVNKTLYHLPPQSGIAFTLEKGQRMRVVDVEGEQVSDLICFAQDDPGEQFSSGRTVDYNGRPGWQPPLSLRPLQPGDV